MNMNIFIYAIPIAIGSIKFKLSRIKNTFTRFKYHKQQRKNHSHFETLAFLI